MSSQTKNDKRDTFIGFIIIVLACLFINSCFFNNSDEKETSINEESTMKELQEVKSSKSADIENLNKYIQTKIPNSNVHVDLSTNGNDFIVMIDINLNSNDTEKAKKIVLDSIKSLSDSPSSVARYDFTFLNKGKMVCMITKEKNIDKLSMFSNGKTVEF